MVFVAWLFLLGPFCPMKNIGFAGDHEGGLRVGWLHPRGAIPWCHLVETESGRCGGRARVSKDGLASYLATS